MELLLPTQTTGNFKDYYVSDESILQICWMFENKIYLEGNERVKENENKMLSWKSNKNIVSILKCERYISL